MSVFDLFRGFFGVSGGQSRDRRDPFFDALTHEDDDDEEEDGFDFDGIHRDQQHPFGGIWRFGFSFGPDGTEFKEPKSFDQILEELDKRSGHSEVPPSRDSGATGRRASSGNPLRDSMLKYPDHNATRPPMGNFTPSLNIPVYRWKQFSLPEDIKSRRGPQDSPKDKWRGDRDLDSEVSSRGVDCILAPPTGQTPKQPRSGSFFQSVTVTKVVRPDGSFEERRTIRDSQGKEQTSTTVSGGPGSREGPDSWTRPVVPDDFLPFSQM